MISGLLINGLLLFGPETLKPIPYFETFLPNQYHAHNQNWCMVQDAEGVLNFGNTVGVLIFDGVQWDLVPTEHDTCVRGLAFDDTGTLLVGGVGEFG